MQHDSIKSPQIPELTARTIEFVNSHFRVLLLFTLMVSLFVRTVALFQLKQTPYFDFLLWDERIYHEWAKQIASGSYSPQAAYEFSPLPAYLMASIYWLFSPNVFYIRILSICFGVLTCTVIALIGREIAGRLSGLTAGLIAALYAPFILYSIVPLKTAFSVLLCSVLIYLLVIELQHPTMIRALLFGLVTGLAFNVRGNYNVFIVVGLAAVFYSAWTAKIGKRRIFFSSFSFVFGLCLVMAPFAIRNYSLTDEFILSTTQSGFNFYIGNNVINKDPYYRPLPFASPSPFKQGVQFTIEASRRTGKTLTASQASSYWYHEAFREALANPADYLAKLGRKALVLVNRFEAADHYDIEFLSQFIPVFALPLFNFTLIWPLGMAGLALAVTIRKSLGWLLAAFIAYALTLVIFFTNARYRLPLLTILIPFVPFGAVLSADAIRRRDYAKACLYFFVLVVLTAVEFLPVRATNDRTAYYNTHAIVLYNSGRENEAVRYWKISSGMNQFFSPAADRSLAHFFFRQRDLQRAEAHLAKINDSSYLSATKYELLGDIFYTKGEIRQAIQAYDRSLAINSADIGVRRKLISLLNNMAPTRVFEEHRRLTKIEQFYKGL